MSGCEQQLLPSRVNTAPHRETTITHQLNKKSQAPNKAIMTPPQTAITHRQHNKNTSHHVAASTTAPSAQVAQNSSDRNMHAGSMFFLI